MTRPILFALALATLGFAAPALAQDAMYDPCDADDTACRIDRLERTVSQMAERLAYYERGAAPVVAAPPQRAVAVPVQSACSGSGCASVAAQTCRTAGFPRGVPAAFANDNGITFMIQVTCMD